MNYREMETIGVKGRWKWFSVAIGHMTAVLVFMWPIQVSHAAPESVRAADLAAKAAVCGGCHGADGNSVVPNFPKLAGQQEDYLQKQLADFKNGSRGDAMMVGMVAGLSAEDVDAVAKWFAAQKLSVPEIPPAKSSLGERLYQRGEVTRGIPPCAACHGVTGGGYPGFMPGGVPAVAGQHAAYTAKQLKAFRAGDRANDKNGMMRQVSTKLSDQEIDALAAYLTTLTPDVGP
jgi:cytochrome c553